ncbi:MAG: ComEC/Rec2 family competence protein [Pirellulales bacterium]
MESAPAAAAPRYQPLVAVVVAVATGIAFDAYGPQWSLGALGLAGGIGLAVWAIGTRKFSNAAGAAPLLLGWAALGAGWHHAWWNLYAADEVARFARLDQAPACVEAVVVAAPRLIPAPRTPALGSPPRGDRTRAIVELVAVRDGDHWRSASGRTTLLVEGHLLGYGAGDRVRIVGQLARPLPPDNPGEFDFARHQRGDRLLTVLRCETPDCVKKLATGSSWSLRRLLDNLRAAGDRDLHRYVTASQLPVAQALLLGQREAIEPDEVDAYMETGSIHLLSISGLHVGILAAALLSLLRLGWLPRRTALASVALLTAAYVLVSGAEPPAVRAAVLVALLCGGQWLGRANVGFNALSAAALLVLALNPADLFRVGPQLSFMAVATMGWWYRWSRASTDEDGEALERLVERARPWPQRAALRAGRWFWHLTLVGVAIWAVSLPLTMAHFHLLSLSSIPLNPLLWIPSTVALLAGFGVLLFGWFLPPLALVCGWLCSAGLSVMDGAIAVARELPSSHFWVAGPATWWLLGFYGLLGAWLAWPRLRLPPRWSAAVLVLWCAAGAVAPSLAGEREPQLRLTFVSVGHGCGALLELPDGQNVLYDAGALGSPQGAARSIADCLWSRGITHLDAVIVSHADADHFNALPELVERFSIGVVYTTPYTLDSDSSLAQAVFQVVREVGVPVRSMWSGDKLRVGGECRVEALHPLEREAYTTDNASSLVLSIEYAGRRLLLPGDLEAEGMRDLLAEAPLDCDLVMAPHHGSPNSNPPNFLAWSDPEHVVISGGRGRDLEGAQTAFRGTTRRVWHTARDGAVTAVVRRSGEFTVSGWVNER